MDDKRLKKGKVPRQQADQKARAEYDKFNKQQRIESDFDREVKKLLQKKDMEGFTDVVTGEARRGFMDVVSELEQRFPDPAAIEKEADKKAFVKLFGEYLRIENILQNYDEFASLKALQNVDINDPEAVEAFKAEHYLNDEDFAVQQTIRIPAERKIQDYRSTYNNIRDWLRRENLPMKKGNPPSIGMTWCLRWTC